MKAAVLLLVVLAAATAYGQLNQCANWVMDKSKKSITGKLGGLSNEFEVLNCAGGHNPEIAHLYRAWGSGTVRMTTKGSAFDTVLYVLTACPPATLYAIACNDDTAGKSYSTIEFPVISGLDYLVVVDGFGEAGKYTLTILEQPDCDLGAEACTDSIGEYAFFGGPDDDDSGVNGKFPVDPTLPSPTEAFDYEAPDYGGGGGPPPEDYNTYGGYYGRPAVSKDDENDMVAVAFFVILLVAVSPALVQALWMQSIAGLKATDGQAADLQNFRVAALAGMMVTAFIYLGAGVSNQWLHRDQSGLEQFVGLWRTCTKSGGSMFCVDTHPADKYAHDFRAAKAFMVLSMVFLFFAVAVLAYSTVMRDLRKNAIFSGAATLCVGVAIVTGLLFFIIFESIINDDDFYKRLDRSVSYGFFIIGFLMLFLCAGIAFWVHSKHMSALSNYSSGGYSPETPATATGGGGGGGDDLPTYQSASKRGKKPPSGKPADSVVSKPGKKVKQKGTPLQAHYIDDANIADGTAVAPGQKVVKRWLLKNSCSVYYPAGVGLAQTAGPAPAPAVAHAFFPPTSTTPVGSETIADGAEFELGVAAVTPAADGPCTYTFRLVDVDGRQFGPKLTLDVDVAAGTPRDAAAGSDDDYDAVVAAATKAKAGGSAARAGTVPAKPAAAAAAAPKPAKRAGAAAGGSTAAAASSAAPACKFISDVTIDDGTVVAAGAKLGKTWRLKATGSAALPAGVVVRPIDGGDAGAAIFCTVDGGVFTSTDAVQAGADFLVSVAVACPAAAGRYFRTYRLHTAEGTPFGPKLMLDCTVDAAAAVDPANEQAFTRIQSSA